MADYSREHIMRLLAERAQSDPEHAASERDQLMTELRHYQAKLAYLKSENYAVNVGAMLSALKTKYPDADEDINTIIEYTNRFI